MVGGSKPTDKTCIIFATCKIQIQNQHISIEKITRNTINPPNILLHHHHNINRFITASNGHSKEAERNYCHSINPSISASTST